MSRQLMAFVAADVVDYSRHLADNPDLTLAVIERHRREVVEPALEKADARIIRTQGDSLLIAFASVTDAVEFALALQSGVGRMQDATAPDARIRFRAGVNLGDVVEAVGELHGDGINIAARLEAIAPPGGICISQAVYEQMEGEIAAGFEPLGPRHLKNIAGPVAVWRWPPAPTLQSAGVAVPRRPASENASGRQVLDPKVGRLLVLLHMRSARLAVLEVLDAILDEPVAGQGMPIDELYKRLGHNLNAARALLADIKVQCIDDIQQYSGGKWPSQMPMSEFISGVFDSSDTSYAMKLLPTIKSILDASDPPMVKRRALMQLVDGFMRADMIPRVEQLMKYAFVDV